MRLFDQCLLFVIPFVSCGLPSFYHLSGMELPPGLSVGFFWSAFDRKNAGSVSCLQIYSWQFFMGVFFCLQRRVGDILGVWRRILRLRLTRVITSGQSRVLTFARLQ